MSLKKIIALCLSLALCLGLGACGETPSGESSSAKDTQKEEVFINLAESWDFSSGFSPVLNPANAVNYGLMYWCGNFYNTLVKYDKGKIVGDAAESWVVSDDQMSYTFTLRDDVFFSDGTKLTASAVKFCFEAALENLGVYRGSIGKVSGLITTVEAPDDLTVVVNLSQPYYGTLNDLTLYNPMGIVNPVLYNSDYTLADTAYTQTGGTGPYMYAGDTDGTSYTFVRNPYYWGEKPEVDGFRIKVIQDNDAKVLALRSGELDAIIGSTRLSYDAYGELRGTDGFGTAVSDSVAMTRYIGFNLTAAPFDDVLVRQAVAYALDKKSICDSVFSGIEHPADTFFYNGIPYCNVDATTYEMNIERACTLMEQAGWIDADGDGVREKNGERLELTLTYTQSKSSLDSAALAVASQLNEIGFRVTPVGSDMMAWYNILLSGDYTIALSSTVGGTFDPFTTVSNMNPDNSSDPIAALFPTQLSRGKAIILELDSTASEERIKEIYQELLGEIGHQVLAVPLSYTYEFGAWNSNVIDGYNFPSDGQYIHIGDIHLK